MQTHLVSQLTQFIRRTSTTLPPDIVRALWKARMAEGAGTGAGGTLGVLSRNAELAEASGVPVCQDTGTLTFWFDLPDGTKTAPYGEAAREAVRKATDESVLRLNVIDTLSGGQVAENSADGNPAVHFKFGAARPRVSLLMKGGGSENMSAQYSLPDSALGAGRDSDGARKCVLDAVWRAQGNGCAPGILGVCLGGDRATGLEKAKEQLLRELDDVNENPELTELETRLLEDANALGIGPMGLGGKTTLLGVKMCAAARLPASYFVSVAYCCWACRRGSMEV